MSLTSFLEYMENYSAQIYSNINTWMPAEIISYDSETRKASVQILTQKIDSDGESITIPILQDVPVELPFWGDFFIHWDLKKGDKGRVCFSSQDLDGYKHLGGKRTPEAYRMFDLNDCIFIPGFKPFNEKTSGLSKDSLTISNKDNTVKIILNNGNKQIDIISPTTKVNGTLNVSTGKSTTIATLDGRFLEFSNGILTNVY